MRSAKVLRISVTDRCDLRCIYCMPEAGVPLVPMADMLSYEEVAAVARAAMAAGVRRFRLTGGEPLARRGVVSLVRLLAGLGPDDLALTTNGLHLAGFAADLKAAGLTRVTVSLDTLRPDRFEAITRRTGLERIFAGLAAARRPASSRSRSTRSSSAASTTARFPISCASPGRRAWSCASSSSCRRAA